MKRGLPLLLSLVLVFSLALPVRAETVEYRLPELDMVVSLPAGYAVITRDIAQDDPLFAQLGMSYAELMDFMVSQYCYLLLITDNGGIVDIAMSPSAWEDLSAVGHTRQLFLAGTLVKQGSDIGMRINNWDIYEHPQLTFIRYDFEDLVADAECIQYVTICGGMEINIVYSAVGGVVTREDAQLLQMIVDGIRLENYEKTVPQTMQTPSSSWTDPNSGLRFTLPQNWLEGTVKEVGNEYSVTFQSAVDPGLFLRYVGIDVWRELTDAEKAVWKRETMDNSFLAEEEIEDLLGGSVPLKTVVYNGKEYYMVRQTEKTQVDGLDLYVDLTYFLRMENGWLCWFLFGSTPENPLFVELEAVMESVVFPASEPEEQMDAETGAESGDSGDISRIVIPLIGLSVGATALLLIKKRKKKGSAAEDPGIYCPECGTKLPRNSKFCGQCGRQIS